MIEKPPADEVVTLLLKGGSPVGYHDPELVSSDQLHNPPIFTAETMTRAEAEEMAAGEPPLPCHACYADHDA